MNRVARVVTMWASLTSLMLMQAAAQERTVFIAEGRIGNAAVQPGQWAAGDFEYDLCTNTAAPAVQGHYPWPNGETVPLEVRYDAATGVAQMKVGWGTNLVWTVPGEPLTSNGVVNIRLGGRGGNVAPGELRLSAMQWETNGVVAVEVPDEFVAPAGGGYQTELISGLPASANWRLYGQVRMTWPDGALPARGQMAFQIAFTEPQQVVQVEWEEDNPEEDVGLQPGNPESHGGGLRFYAEKKTPTGRLHNKVRAKALLAHPVPAGQTLAVYFKAFDVDDPTQNGAHNLVDTNDTATQLNGGDNRQVLNGYDPLGNPIIGQHDIVPAEMVTAIVNAGERMATVEYTIPAAFAGNNWRVAAHLDASVIRETAVDSETGMILKNTTTGVNVLQSPLLSVWRTLWIERDSMEPINRKGVSVLGWVDKAKVGLPNCVGDYQFEASGVIGRDGLRVQDEFEGGPLVFFLYDANGNQTTLEGFTVVKHKNTAFGFRNTQLAIWPPLTPIQKNMIGNAAIAQFRMWDDDDYSVFDKPKRAAGGAVMDLAFAEAYVRIHYADDEEHGNKRPLRKFVRQLTWFDAFFSLDDSQDISSSSSFWASLLVACFEPHENITQRYGLIGSKAGDQDPDGFLDIKGPIPFPGSTPDSDAENGLGPLYGFTLPLGINVSGIFCEVIHDDARWQANHFDEAHVVTHEIGHAADWGIGHSADEDLMNGDPQVIQRNQHFRSEDLAIIRGTIKW